MRPAMLATMVSAISSLYGEDILQFAVEPFCPHVIAGRRFDQLHPDAQPGTGLSDAALDDESDSQLARHLAYIHVLVPELERGIVGDDQQLPEPRKAGNDVDRHAVAEIALICFVAHIDEG